MLRQSTGLRTGRMPDIWQGNSTYPAAARCSLCWVTNGAGKSTLMNVPLTGELPADAGGVQLWAGTG